MSGRAIGIDLGTTHSLVAYVDERGRPVLVEAQAEAEAGTGGALLPSAVHFRAGGVPLVGRAARRLAADHPADTVLSAKRLIGLSPADLRPEDRGVYRFEEEGPVVRLRVAGGRAVTPVEVSAEILRALRRRAAQALGGPPGGCVITVPAWFDDAQRQATRDAGRVAGLEVLRLLPEPTAAALAFGLGRRVRGRFAVYDLGGGTFDLSVLELSEGLFEVRATCGDTRLGGDDMDRLVGDWLLGQAGVGTPSGSAPSPAALRGARELARAAREALSTEQEVAVEAALDGGHRLQARLHRAALEALVRPVVERTVPLCRQALRDAGIRPEEPLDGVVLVGGVTRMPLVRRLVREVFGQEPLHEVDPDTAVALGAALQADALARSGRDDLLLVDVLPLSLGVEMLGGVVERILPRNSPIPAAATQDFTTHADGQTGLSVHVVQGERELARDCRSLARFTLRGIPPMPAGAARVQVAYEVDADGILAVSARELSSGAEQRVQVRANAGLSEAEVERMLVESLQHADEDVAARVLAEWKVEGERVLLALESALREDGALLGDEEREEIGLRLMGLREALRGEDAGAIQAWVSSLDEAARGFSERRMDLHVGRAVRGRRVDEVGEG